MGEAPFFPLTLLWINLYKAVLYEYIFPQWIAGAALLLSIFLLFFFCIFFDTT